MGLTATLQSFAEGTGRKLGPWTGATFRTGDQWQRTMVDWAAGLATPAPGTQRRAMRTLFDCISQSAELLKASAPTKESGLRWLEFQNRIEAFGLFEHVDTALRLPPATCVPLTSLLERCAHLGTYRSVWAVEGSGHYFTESMWRHFGEPHDLLTQPALRGVPMRLTSAVHVGMGMCFAARTLAHADPADASTVERAIARLIDLCHHNAAPGYHPIAFEPLGLVARTLYPHAVPSIHRAIVRRDRELVPYFWHGVGRGIYFAPSHFLPLDGSWRRLFSEALRCSDDEVARGNAVAGAIWAFLLVNIRHPQILESLLRRYPELAATPGFDHGVSSALAVWRELTPDDPSPGALRAHRPCCCLTELWRSAVSRPAERATNRPFDAATAFHWPGRFAGALQRIRQ